MRVSRLEKLTGVAIVISMGVFGSLDISAWAAKNVCEYQQYDWEELSTAEKSAWQTLGYSAQMWDKGRDSSSADEDWDELTPAEKKAAQSLGYTKSSWDNGHC
jgi:hypothetical protein